MLVVLVRGWCWAKVFGPQSLILRPPQQHYGYDEDSACVGKEFFWFVHNLCISSLVRITGHMEANRSRNFPETARQSMVHSLEPKGKRNQLIRRDALYLLCMLCISRGTVEIKTRSGEVSVRGSSRDVNGLTSSNKKVSPAHPDHPSERPRKIVSEPAPSGRLIPFRT